MEKSISHLKAFITELVTEAVDSAMERQHNELANLKNKKDQREEILNAEQAAAHLHIAKQTLYTLTSKRKVPFYKNGKKILFRRGDLDDWLNKGKQREFSRITKAGQTYTKHNPIKK